jgi:hypothetical protein
MSVKAHTGLVVNPAYVEHPTVASKRRIKIAGVHDSDCAIVIGLFQLRNGDVGMAVDGVEANFQELIKVHQLLQMVTTEVDRRLMLHAQTVEGEK